MPPSRPPHAAGAAAPTGTLVTVPVHRTVPGLARDPLRAFAQIGRECGGALARLDLGLTRPYLVTHPDHVRQVLLNPRTYLREGMIWKPLRRLEGDGIAAEGPSWQTSRHLLQPLFTARSLAARQAAMATAVAEALDLLAVQGRDARPLDLTDAMTGIVHRVLIRAFFGDRISHPEAERLGAAITTAFLSLGWRMLLPFVGNAVPLPGDRAFRRAVRTVDDLIYPRIRACRAGGGDDGAAGGGAVDLVALLARTVDGHGEPLDDKRVRDDVVAMFIAGTETTALALTWLWLLIDAHPAVADRLTGEIDAAGGGAPDRTDLHRLPYTRMVLQEALRLYPVGWVVPRTVGHRDVLGGVALRRGATVLLSPYLTHRLPQFWDRPDEFRPERFAPDQQRRRHRFAYHPFGAGVHQCLGSHFFLIEAELIVAGLLSRFRPEVVAPRSLRARATVTLRPRDRARFVLRPRR
jgi:cytochrome P450